ncbi:aminoglycoside phosphotransferase family protein [Kineococcus sp. SYSU DK001]|uniref:aminoglycoside phosphotransferase family protein n=1 Tax=Kineococcus sp. SYSU DK001 TaxID=3383122 RepID=UPI003D7E803C
MPGRRLTPRADLPAVVVAKALRADGGRDRLGRLDDRVAGLAARWGVRVGGPLGGGTAACVLRAERADGTAAVLRLPVPGPQVAGGTRTLLEAGGRGYVRVLAHDGDDLLLERLGPSLDRAGLSPARQARLLAGLLPLVWTEPLQAPVDRAAGLAEFLTGLLDGPTDAVAARALEFAARRSRAFTPGRARWLHGDAAPSNALLAPGRPAGAAFIDPEGVGGDPAYDVGVTLRDFSTDLLAVARPADVLRRWCRGSARATGQDPQAVWEFAFLERVTTGRYAASLGAGTPRPASRGRPGGCCRTRSAGLRR